MWGIMVGYIEETAEMRQYSKNTSQTNTTVVDSEKSYLLYNKLKSSLMASLRGSLRPPATQHIISCVSKATLRFCTKIAISTFALSYKILSKLVDSAFCVMRPNSSECTAPYLLLNLKNDLLFLIGFSLGSLFNSITGGLVWL